MDDGRKRLEYLRKDPRVSPPVLDHDTWYTHLSVQGRAVEIREDVELADPDRLARRYRARPYPKRDRRRVNAWIEAERWHGWGAAENTDVVHRDLMIPMGDCSVSVCSRANGESRSAVRTPEGGAAMSTVVMHNVVSVDGFIADDHDQIGPLFDWYFNGDTPLTEGGSFQVSRPSADYVRPAWAAIGAMVIGRRLFDLMNGWDGVPPAGEHVVVVSHRPKPEGWHPEASYHFVGDVRTAVATARELAGDRTVSVAAGEVGGQCLASGLVDHVAMDVVPVVFGSGRRYFGRLEGQHLLEDPDVVIPGDRVLHLRYPVRRG